MPPGQRQSTRLHRSVVIAALAAGVCALLPGAARAQVGIRATGGLGGWTMPNHWTPVQVYVDYSGPAPVQIEVRGRLGDDPSGDIYVLPQRQLRSGATQRHTLFMRAGQSYGRDQVRLDLFVDGKPAPPPTVLNLRTGADADRLLVHVSEQANLLSALTSIRLDADPAEAGDRFSGGGYGAPSLLVASLKPGDAPELWYGYDAAAAVVLGDVTERDLGESVTAALKDWVRRGGMLVISGGPNWPRLTTPWFQELLPVTPTGSSSPDGLTGLSSLGGRTGPARGAIPLVLSTARPDATVSAAEKGAPLVARRRYGSGMVVFVAFDPAAPSFRGWEGAQDFWKALLQSSRPPRSVVQAIAAADQPQYANHYYGEPTRETLAAAPLGIQELDIPGFDFVAILLLAYVICLVPLNYVVLRKLDKKEWAWVSTPVIVAVFSLIAYGVAYGQKGGRALLVPVSVIEADAGASRAPALLYAGLFSPGKSLYRITSADNPALTLQEAPSYAADGRPGLRVEQAGDMALVDVPIDMWAMRIFRGEAMVDLGEGITAEVTRDGATTRVTLTNGTRFQLIDGALLVGAQAYRVGDIAAGGAGTAEGLPYPLISIASPSHQRLRDAIPADAAHRRMRERVLDAFVSAGAGAGVGDALFVAWSDDPVFKLEVNGVRVRERASHLFLVRVPLRQ